MTERTDLLASIAATTADYREGDLAAPTPDHVDRWVRQFDEDVQIPILREMNHVVKQTYFSKEWVSGFFANQIKHDKLTGSNPASFWKSAHFLDIQQNGNSQSEIGQLFGKALLDQLGLEIESCGNAGGAYIYLDDVIFTGGRVKNDLTAWIRDEAPAKAVVHILVIATHRLGEWQCTESLKKVATEVGKKVNIHVWAAARFENRKAYRNRSDVLWPATVTDDPALAAYLEQQGRFPLESRQPGGEPDLNIFSSEDGRQLLEREFLMAGVNIRGFCQNPNAIMRPLGFSGFGVGFGSTIVTYRNCPNNAPLALWWGDPDAPTNHPFSRWYPLFQRKTYEREVDFDDFDL
ncbi:phosphoribosyltransferase-like protein [Profundibacter sp.]|uniref:phosphoribosyltransferase-like protein n=1 Tax=Profundibacter sp. TaxID=3101071 RepID=UPI003D14C501